MGSKRLLLVASAGGHWVQLARLTPAFAGHETLYVTTLDGAKAPSGNHDVKVVRDTSRSDPLSFFQLIVQLLAIILRYRPEVVITTGAAPGLIAVQLGHILGCRTVWLDSIANSEELSMSGRLAKRFSTLWLTQWPEVAASYTSLKYFGSVL